MARDEDQKDKHHLDDGSPITVGGGGGKNKDKDKDKAEDIESNVRCVFKDGDYLQTQPGVGHGKKKFRHNGWKIKTFKIRNNGTWEDHSDLLPNTGNCTIVIRCEGDDDDVIINGSDFGIDMDPETYQNAGSGVHRNPNADSYISRVDLLGPGQSLGSWQFVQDDEAMVCTDHMPNSKYCPSPDQ